MKISDTIQLLESKESEKLMTALYGKEAVRENIERYQSLIGNFQKKFPEDDVMLFPHQAHGDQRKPYRS